MAKAVGFSESAARRIGNAVRTVERGSRDQSAVRFRQPGDDSAVQLGKTTAAWAKGTSATIDLWPSGVISSPLRTQQALNVFADVAAGRFVMLGLESGGMWMLIAAECE